MNENIKVVANRETGLIDLNLSLTVEQAMKLLPMLEEVAKEEKIMDEIMPEEVVEECVTEEVLDDMVEQYDDGIITLMSGEKVVIGDNFKTKDYIIVAKIICCDIANHITHKMSDVDWTSMILELSQVCPALARALRFVLNCSKFIDGGIVMPSTDVLIKDYQFFNIKGKFKGLLVKPVEITTNKAKEIVFGNILNGKVVMS